MNFIVAIDGPAGSGKSTIAKLIAKDFNYTYLDTGAMYRMITLACINKKINLENLEEVKELLENINLNIKGNEFFLEGEDVSNEIRNREVTSMVSKVASISLVRKKLVPMQREISSGKRVILDGRDIGTVVFPNAQVKIFLNASASERAKRRLLDYKNKGEKVSYEEILRDIIKRDKADSEREEAPLKKAKDATELDTSKMTITEVVKKIVEIIDKKLIDRIIK